MKIGIIGVGSIGKTLTQRLSAAGHEVTAANSRGPDTIDADVFSAGGRAATVGNAVSDAEAIILSIPLSGILSLAHVVASLPAEVVVIDTANYYPARDQRIDAIENGMPESIWFADRLGRPVVKAWNSVGSHSFRTMATSSTTPNRIALPVAADRDVDRRVGMDLVDQTGFDAVDAGSLADSWRQQPGSPAYCTDLTRDELPRALESAEAARLPRRRDIGSSAVHERYGAGENPDADYLRNLNRALYM